MKLKKVVIPRHTFGYFPVRKKDKILNHISEHLVNIIMDLECSKDDNLYPQSLHQSEISGTMKRFTLKVSNTPNLRNNSFLARLYTLNSLGVKHQVILTLNRREFLLYFEDIKNLLVNDLSFDPIKDTQTFLNFLSAYDYLNYHDDILKISSKAYISPKEMEMGSYKFGYMDKLYITFKCELSDKQTFDCFSYENNVIFNIIAHTK